MFGSMDFQSERFARTFESRKGRWGGMDLYVFAAERGGPGRGGRRGGPCSGKGDRQRVPRGDIKYILLALLAEQPHHGYQLMNELEARWGGFYRPSPGSVYPTLQMLEESEYVTSESIDGKRVYTITDQGRALLAEQQGTVEGLNPLEQQPQLIELRKTLQELQEVIVQVTRQGNADRIGRVLAQLKQLKREIYLMLAEND